MQVSVTNIEINESIDKIIVNVVFSQPADDIAHNRPHSPIYLPYEDEAALGEIEAVAVDRAYNFLKTALTGRS